MISAEYHDHGAKDVLGAAGHAKVKVGWWHGIRQSIALISKYHRTKEMVLIAESGTRLTRSKSYSGIVQPAHPSKVTSRTGAWRRSFATRIDDKQMLGGYGSDAKLAQWLEEGTKAHPIEARAIDSWGGFRMGAMLRFPAGASLKRGRAFSGDAADWKTNFIFRRKVNHPGTSPRPTLQNTVNATHQQIALIMGNGIETELRKAGK